MNSLCSSQTSKSIKEKQNKWQRCQMISRIKGFGNKGGNGGSAPKGRLKAHQGGEPALGFGWQFPFYPLSFYTVRISDACSASWYC